MKKEAAKGYSTDELEAQALEEIVKRKLVFFDEIASYLPCSRATCYNHGLDKLDSIKTALEKNRVDLKAGLRKKWYEGDNATTQIALYKLIGTDDEAHRLNGSKHEVTGKDGAAIVIDLNKYLE